MRTRLCILILLLCAGGLFAQTVEDPDTAIKNGRVTILWTRGTGASSGNAIEGALRNNTGAVIRLNIYFSQPLYFINSGQGQNMVAIMLVEGGGSYYSDGIYSFIDLEPGTTEIEFIAFCTDFEKENPSSSESFRTGSLPRDLEAVTKRVLDYYKTHPDEDTLIAAQVALWLARGSTATEIRKKFDFSSADEALARRLLGR